MKKKRKTSGIIIIGNEILSGKTLETNSNFMCKKLFDVGISCEEINTIKDEECKIIEKVNFFRNKYDYVFTSGGIGPTHDDITSASIAKAFKRKLVLNQEARKLLEKHYSDDVLTKARLKMAYFPENVKLIDNPVSIAPGFFIENLYVLPGVPKIMETMFEEIVKSLDEGLRYYKKIISTILSEGIIGDFVEEIQKKFPSLEIGSYPYFKKNSFGVSLVVKGIDDETVLKATSEIHAYISSINGNPEIY